MERFKKSLKYRNIRSLLRDFKQHLINVYVRLKNGTPETLFKKKT